MCLRYVARISTSPTVRCCWGHGQRLSDHSDCFGSFLDYVDLKRVNETERQSFTIVFIIGLVFMAADDRALEISWRLGFGDL